MVGAAPTTAVAIINGCYTLMVTNSTF